MGLSSSSKKTTTDPWKPAQPYILNGLQQTQSVFDAQQPQLNAASNTAQQAFNAIAPGAFGTNPFVQSAQNAAQGFTSGQNMGTNLGANTYAQFQATANPAMPTLASLTQGSQSPGNYAGVGAANPGLASLANLQSGGSNSAIPGLTALGYGMGSGGAGDAALGSIAYGTGGSNPGDAYASAVAGGKYLNAQPSAQLYADTLAGKYLDTGNPYLQSIIDQTNADVTKSANQRFGAAGMGAGIGSAFANVLSKNLANNESTLRYNNYDTERNRQVQTAGQSDSAFNNERSQMTAATGQLSSNYNNAQANQLAAAQALSSGTRADNSLSLQALGQLSDAGNQQFANQLQAGNAIGSLYNSTGNLYLNAQQAADSAFQNDRAAQLNAAQAYGSQYTAGQNTQLNAAQAGDATQNARYVQMIDALGLTGQLRTSEYAGIDPALNLLNTSAASWRAGYWCRACPLKAWGWPQGERRYARAPRWRQPDLRRSGPRWGGWRRRAARKGSSRAAVPAKAASPIVCLAHSWAAASAPWQGLRSVWRRLPWLAPTSLSRCTPQASNPASIEGSGSNTATTVCPDARRAHSQTDQTDQTRFPVPPIRAHARTRTHEGDTDNRFDRFDRFGRKGRGTRRTRCLDGSIDRMSSKGTPTPAGKDASARRETPTREELGKDQLAIERRPGQTDGYVMAESAIHPTHRHAKFASVFATSAFASDDPPAISDSVDVVAAACAQVRGGDLGIASDVLVGQLLTLDAVSTDMLRRATMNLGQHPDAAERYMRLCFKAQAQSRATIEALAAIHRPREQTVRHVHVHEGGQAVVADEFHHHAAGGQIGKADGQAQATRTGGPAELAALSCADPLGAAVQVTGGARGEALPHARRGTRQRRAKGE